MNSSKRRRFSLDNSRDILRHAFRYLGPGFFVTVGFIDPGNWATNIAAGSRFNYDLLWVVTLSTAILILWQHMSAHLGIITGLCLAEAVHRHMNRGAVFIYGLTAMMAIIATALAEIIGIAIGLLVLFYVPLQIGVVFGALFVLLLIWFQKYGSLEKLIVGFVSAIGFCYLIELYLVKPDWGLAAYHAVVPKLNSGSILIAMGVLGAVVMPHNMYLHSEVIQNRNWKGQSEEDTRRLLRFEFVDTIVAMLVGMAINAAMVIVAAAVFYRNGVHIDALDQAALTLKPLAGPFASLLFGTALLFAGISSSMTAGIAGGSVLSGYAGKGTKPGSKWFKAGVMFTIIPAVIIAVFVKDTFKALIISQVCLSIQLPFTMLPLYILTNSKHIMGEFVNGWFERLLMIITGITILLLNALLLYNLFGGEF